MLVVDVVLATFAVVRLRFGVVPAGLAGAAAVTVLAWRLLAVRFVSAVLAGPASWSDCWLTCWRAWCWLRSAAIASTVEHTVDSAMPALPGSVASCDSVAV